MDVRQYGISETFMGNFVRGGSDPDRGGRRVVSDVLRCAEGLHRGNAGADFGYDERGRVIWERVCI